MSTSSVVRSSYRNRHATGQKNRVNLVGIGLLECFSFLYGLSYAEFIPIIGTVHVQILITCAAVLYSIIIMYINRVELELPLVLILLYSYFSIAVNMMNGGDFRWTFTLVQVSAISLYFYSLCKSGKSTGIVAFLLACNIWCVLSLGDVLEKMILPSYYEGRILKLCGYDNGLGAYLLPVMAIDLFMASRSKHKLYYICMSVVAMLQFFLMWTVTSMVGAILLLITFMIYPVLKNRKYTSLVYCLMGVLIFVVFVILRKFYLNIVETIVVNYLHKTMDFSLRTIVWDLGIKYFLESPLFGHGRNVVVLLYVFCGVSASHNFYLDILNQSGIIGFLIFCSVVFYLIRNGSSEGSSLPSLLLFCIIAVSQFESYSAYHGFSLLYALIALALWSNALDKRVG